MMALYLVKNLHDDRIDFNDSILPYYDDILADKSHCFAVFFPHFQTKQNILYRINRVHCFLCTFIHLLLLLLLCLFFTTMHRQNKQIKKPQQHQFQMHSAMCDRYTMIETILYSFSFKNVKRSFVFMRSCMCQF